MCRVVLQKCAGECSSKPVRQLLALRTFLKSPSWQLHPVPAACPLANPITSASLPKCKRKRKSVGRLQGRHLVPKLPPLPLEPQRRRDEGHPLVRCPGRTWFGRSLLRAGVTPPRVLQAPDSPHGVMKHQSVGGIRKCVCQIHAQNETGIRRSRKQRMV